MIINYCTETNMSYIYLEPFKAKFSDAENTDKLYIRLIFDNLSNSSNFYYELKGNNLNYRNNFIISGDSYNCWQGDSEYIFMYILNKLNLICVDPPIEENE